MGKAEIDGAEVGFYRMRAGCGSTELTFSATCQSILCTFFPPFQYSNCAQTTCSADEPVTCNNTLLGYLLSPNIN